MSDESSLSTKEIVGIAAAGAIALGGLITALTRSQERSTQDAVADVLTSASEQVADQADSGRNLAGELIARLAAAYPALRDELALVTERASDEFGNRRGQLSGALDEHLPSGLASSLVEQVDALRERAVGLTRDAVEHAPDSVEQIVARLAPDLVAPQTHRLRDTAAAVALLSIVSAVVYSVLLSAERREQLKDAACRLLSFGQTLGDDFRGVDDGY